MSEEDKKNPIRTITIDDEINSIAEKPTLLMFLVMTWSMTWSMVGAFHAYVIIFTGFIPYNDWKCVSKKCFDLLANHTQEKGTFIGRNQMCDNDLIVRKDFIWTTNRTTFSVDWDIYCGNEYKLAFVNSIYWIGAVVGLLCGTMLFETIGRRRGSQYMGLATLLVNFANPFCNTYELLVTLRMIEGCLQISAYMGFYIWVLEFVPKNFRLLFTSFMMLIWAKGYILITCVSYLISTWQYIMLTLNLLSIFAIIPVFLFPDSPRYLLQKGKDEETKRVLELFSRISNESRKYDNVTFVKDVDKVQEMSIREKLTMLKKYPVFLKECLLQMFLWTVCSLLCYGFSYSWSSFGKNLYTSYLLAAVGESLAYLILLPLSFVCGRNSSMITLMAGASVSYLIAMISLDFGGDWTLERLSSLFGTVLVTAAFGLVFLYTGELSPTTHRGFVMSSSSLVARLGAFAGPYVPLLFASVGRQIPLLLFAVLAALSVLACCFLPETTGIPIPESAYHVYQRDINKPPTTRAKVIAFIQGVAKPSTTEVTLPTVIENSTKC